MCGGVPQHCRALGLGGVAGANGRRDARRLQSRLLGEQADGAPRLGQVLVNVGAQRLQRRHVYHPDLVGQRTFEARAEEVVERRQKGGERLAGSGRRGDERVTPGADRLPAPTLCGHQLSERVAEPLLDERVKSGERHGSGTLREWFTFAG